MLPKIIYLVDIPTPTTQPRTTTTTTPVPTTSEEGRCEIKISSTQVYN